MQEGARVSDSIDGTDEDIALVFEEFRRLVVTRQPQEVLGVSLINLLELVLQSARTRICIVNLEKLNNSNYCSSRDLENSIIFYSFRQIKFFTKFCEKIARQQTDIYSWLLQNSCILELHGCQKISICLVRVRYPSTLTYLPQQDAALEESYKRLFNFFKFIKNNDIFLKIFLDAINALKLKSHSNSSLHCTLPSNVTDNYWAYDEILEPLYDCVNKIYEEFSGIPLIRVLQKNSSKTEIKPIDYSNIFFFIRLSASLSHEVNAKGTQDGFMVKLVIPRSQRKHLSRFFHEQREEKCPWFNPPYNCGVKNIKKCIFSEKWNSFPISNNNDEEIYDYYNSIWKKLAGFLVSKPRLAGIAFRTNTIVFERRALSSLEQDETQVLSKLEADQILSCIKSRFVKAPNSSEKYSEDHVPQMMFVPIYHGEIPIVAVATVVNTHENELLTLPNEWQKAFYFAGFVYRSLAYRFKAHLRDAYLELISKNVKIIYSQFAESSLLSKEDKIINFINEINRCLANLAKIYAYPKFSLHLREGFVINRDIQGLFFPNLLDNVAIVVEPASYWQQPIEKQWFDKQKVFKCVQAAIFECIAESEIALSKQIASHHLQWKK